MDREIFKKIYIQNQKLFLFSYRPHAVEFMKIYRQQICIIEKKYIKTSLIWLRDNDSKK